MTQGPYHLFSIGFLLIIGYLLSTRMVRMQLFPVKSHRKIWNYLLLIFFISMSSLGFVLAVKTNYKLELSWIDEAMQWHVDLGIGFAFIALFHLSWHLRYYGKMTLSAKDSSWDLKWNPYLSLKAKQHKLLFILLGSISIISQLVLLREFIKTFHGNELVIGIFLALWMMLTSAGAWAGMHYKTKIPLASILRLYLMLGSASLVIYLLLILIDRFLFLPGYEPGTLVSMIYILLLISLFTLTSGFLFSYLTRAIKTETPNAKNYRFESYGSLFGGFLFGLVGVFLFSNVQLCAFLWLSTVLAILFAFNYPLAMHQRLILVLSALMLFLVLTIPLVRNKLEGLRYQNETVLETGDTPYGNITLTERDGQVTGYLDRNPILYTGDLVRAEESVHFPALQHPNPASFLLMGGGLSGTIAEIEKYKPTIFDYCEADRWFYRKAAKHLPPPGKNNFHFIPMDGRQWLTKADGIAYDVIISEAPDPYTIGWNRFFTTEFYELIKQHLSPDGIFCMQLQAGGNYVNDRGIKLLQINYQTLEESFAQVVIVPGQISYFLASQQPLSLDFPALLEKHSIITTYVHPDFLDGMSLQFDSDLLMERLNDPAVGINSDMWPRLFFSSLSNLETRIGSQSLRASGLIAVILFLLLLFLFPVRTTGIYITGFTGAGIQILLIFMLQSLYGFAYLVAPLLISLFMAGIILGLRVWQALPGAASPKKMTAMIGSMALIDAIGVVLLKNSSLLYYPVAGPLLLGLLNLLPGIIVGAVFGMSVKLAKANAYVHTGRLYSADLAGAALGSFIPVVFLLPLIGVTNTFILFCGINVATGLFVLLRWR